MHGTAMADDNEAMKKEELVKLVSVCTLIALHICSAKDRETTQLPEMEHALANMKNKVNRLEHNNKCWTGALKDVQNAEFCFPK